MTNDIKARLDAMVHQLNARTKERDAANARADAAEAQVKSLTAERDALKAVLKPIKDAVDFYDRCKADPDASYTTGAFKDAHDWVFDAARCAALNLGGEK